MHSFEIASWFHQVFRLVQVTRVKGKQLGGTLQFRSAVEFAFCFDDRSRLGLQIGHLSNAGIYSENPGTEFVVLNFSVPTIVFSR